MTRPNFKTKRVKNRSVLDAIKKEPCVECGCRPCDPAHIRSVGARGDDVYSNVIPLCRFHHREQHRIGWISFVLKYLRVWEHLRRMGWFVFNGKLLKSSSADSSNPDNE